MPAAPPDLPGGQTGLLSVLLDLGLAVRPRPRICHRRGWRRSSVPLGWLLELFRFWCRVIFYRLSTSKFVGLELGFGALGFIHA